MAISSLRPEEKSFRRARATLHGSPSPCSSGRYFRSDGAQPGSPIVEKPREKARVRRIRVTVSSVESCTRIRTLAAIACPDADRLLRKQMTLRRGSTLQDPHVFHFKHHSGRFFDDRAPRPISVAAEISSG